MSGYEEEHNISRDQPTSQQADAASRRPDLSSFFSQLSEVSSSGTPNRPQNNPHALPMPGDMAALYMHLAEAYRQIGGGAGPVGIETPHGEISHEHGALIEGLIDELMRGARDPPREVEGVPESFLADLDRIPKAKLNAADTCPICGNPFLDDPYPLVVRLPCHKDHIFDLECITPWLKLKSTCPLDRQDLLKKKPEPIREPAKDEEEDGEYDDMFA